MAEHYDPQYEPGYGFFFDFMATPEFKEPVIRYFTEVMGWTLDYDST